MSARLFPPAYAGRRVAAQARPAPGSFLLLCPGPTPPPSGGGQWGPGGEEVREEQVLGVPLGGSGVLPSTQQGTSDLGARMKMHHPGDSRNRGFSWDRPVCPASEWPTPASCPAQRHSLLAADRAPEDEREAGVQTSHVFP